MVVDLIKKKQEMEEQDEKEVEFRRGYVLVTEPHDRDPIICYCEKAALKGSTIKSRNYYSIHMFDCENFEFAYLKGNNLVDESKEATLQAMKDRRIEIRYRTWSQGSYIMAVEEGNFLFLNDEQAVVVMLSHGLKHREFSYHLTERASFYYPLEERTKAIKKAAKLMHDNTKHLFDKHNIKLRDIGKIEKFISSKIP
ncbi:hypothetical protein KY331_00965 [Candidatus Woesearchaeota archaeon]|nr:hypothetical protein [Candidatus Woesearchaeota archaeon]